MTEKESSTKQASTPGTTQNSMLRIMDQAPDFEATMTQGDLRLSGFTGKGKW